MTAIPLYGAEGVEIMLQSAKEDLLDAAELLSKVVACPRHNDSTRFDVRGILIVLFTDLFLNAASSPPSPKPLKPWITGVWPWESEFFLSFRGNGGLIPPSPAD